MKTDYEELEGKEIDYVYKDGEKVKAKVVGCNYDIGISIVRSDNLSHHVVCFNGPMSPLWDKRHHYANEYDTMFVLAVRMIEKGTVFVKVLDDNRRQLGHINPLYLFDGPTPSMCPFGA